MQTLRTLGFGLTLLASALTLLLPQPVAAQYTGCIPFFSAPLVPAPHCSTTTSFVLINADRSLQIVIVGLQCGEPGNQQFVNGLVTLRARQVCLSPSSQVCSSPGEISEAGTMSMALVGGTGVVTAIAGGGTLLANCGNPNDTTFGATCQSLIIAVEDQAGVVEVTGVQ